MAPSERRYDDEDLIKRAQKRLKDINEHDEQLRTKLRLPAEAKYTLSSLLREDEVAATAVTQAATAARNHERTHRWSSLLVLACAVATALGLLIFGLGLAITRVSGANSAFATPLATLVTAFIVACIMLLQARWNWDSLMPALSHAPLYGRASNYFTALNLSLPTEAPPATAVRKESWSSPAGRPPAKAAARKGEGVKDKGAWILVTLSLLAVSIASMFLNLISPGQTQSAGQKTATHVNSEVTGLSYGSTAFDVHRTDGDVKLQAAAKLTSGDARGALPLWDKAIALDKSDAEAYIYRENTRILLSGRPHLTLAAGTIFSKGVTGLGRNDLQGAYLAQKEYNDRMQRTGGVQLLILVAVANDDPVSVTGVAQQIVQEAQHDSTLLGVMGWPTSTSALAAVKVLTAAHIPLLSESATSDVLTGISPYFFRMGTDTRQAIVGATYALDVLHAKRVAVFEDPANAYSKSLADAFINTFNADGKHTIIKELFTVKQSDSLAVLVQDALAQHIDMIYMSGYAADVSLLLTVLPPCSDPSSCIQVLGGDALNTLGDYQPTAYKNFPRVHFTAFAYAGRWRDEGQQATSFFSDFQETFGPKVQRDESSSSRILPDADAILAFDSLNALLHAIERQQLTDKGPLTPEKLRQQLTTIAFAGVSGRITFDHNGNVIDKAVIILHLDDDHRAHLEPGF